MEKVSVVMPAFNTADYIEYAIASVLSQTYTNFHLYIIDDASTDATGEIVQRFTDDPRVTYYRNERRLGRAETINMGIDMAAGEFIAFCDSDAIWEKNKLFTQVNILQTKRYDMVCSHYATFLTSVTKLAKTYKSQEIITYRDLLRGHRIADITGMYNQAKLGKVYLENVPHQEYLMWLSLLKRAKGTMAYCVPETLAYCRISPRQSFLSKNHFTGWQWRIYRDYLRLPYYKSFYYYLSSLAHAMKRSV
jgi:glycosyltransferase involved in cell wall biosynthesis